MFWKRKKKSSLGGLPVAMLFWYHGLCLLVLRKNKETGQNLLTIPTGSPDEKDIGPSGGSYSAATLIREACEELKIRPEDIKKTNSLDVVLIGTRQFHVVNCVLTKNGFESAKYEEDGNQGQIWIKPPSQEEGLKYLTPLSPLAIAVLTLLIQQKKGETHVAEKECSGNRILSP